MTPYQRGARLEYRARDVLRAQGYVVMRSAGSHGPADLVALNRREVLLVQVKHAGQSLRLALTALAQLPTPPHTRKQVWVYEPARPSEGPLARDRHPTEESLMSHDLTYQLTDGDDATRSRPIIIRLSTHAEVIVPDAARREQAVVRVELFDGRLQALVWDGRTVTDDGEPLSVPLELEVAHD